MLLTQKSEKSSVSQFSVLSSQFSVLSSLGEEYTDNKYIAIENFKRHRFLLFGGEMCLFCFKLVISTEAKGKVEFFFSTAIEVTKR